MEGYTKYNDSTTPKDMYNVVTSIKHGSMKIGTNNNYTVKIPGNVPEHLIRNISSEPLLMDILKIGNGTFLSGWYLLELIYNNDNYYHPKTADIDIFTHKDNITKILQLFEDKKCIVYATGKAINIYLEGYHHIIQIIAIDVKDSSFITKFHYDMTMMAVYYENNILQTIIKNGIIEDMYYQRTKLSTFSEANDSDKKELCRMLAKLEAKEVRLHCNKKILNIISDLFEESINKDSDILKMFFTTSDNILFQCSLKKNLDNLTTVENLLIDKGISNYNFFGINNKQSNSLIISNIISQINSGNKYF